MLTFIFNEGRKTGLLFVKSRDDAFRILKNRPEALQTLKQANNTCQKFGALILPLNTVVLIDNETYYNLNMEALLWKKQRY